MPELYLGEVTHFFGNICVAVLSLSDTIAVGDEVHITGRSTELIQTVRSLQIDHRPVRQADAGDDVALEVLRPVRRHDRVFIILPEE